MFLMNLDRTALESELVPQKSGPEIVEAELEPVLAT
jgi:hypothetical protein